MNQEIYKVIQDLRTGSMESLTPELIKLMNQIAVDFLYEKDDTKSATMLPDIYGILMISNILYNNTALDILPLEDGVYDLVVVKYNNFTGDQSPVGAVPVVIDTSTSKVGNANDSVLNNSQSEIGKLEVCKRVKKDDMIFFNNIVANSIPMQAFYDHSNKDMTLIEKKYKNTPHTYPELVGTLDKCKFVLNDEAVRKGVFDDASTEIFERDFMWKNYQLGLNVFDLIIELKYDGISVEAEVQGDTIISARTRGDTANNKAADLTPIFGGYKFPKAVGRVQPGTIFGIKFECIITKQNLFDIERDFGKYYANGRNAVIGLTEGLDAKRYLSYLTLVPIACAGLNFPSKLDEISFLNEYYSSGVDMKYAIIHGTDYNTTLYQVYKFTNEAEYMRRFMDFMYDGVVVSCLDPNSIARLGRVGSVDKWSIAIKFNASVKDTIFYGYTYSIGQNGVVTPMAYFKPVEFLGSIHGKTTAHSLKRFKQLALKAGDIVQIEYRNDVICYIDKKDTNYNRANPNPVIEFPEYCPSCGTKLVFSEDSARCPNLACPERNIARVTNMMKKLAFKDFSEAYVKLLRIDSLRTLLSYPNEQAESIIGKVMADKFSQRIYELLTTPIEDYKLVGALGFTSIAADKWKIILKDIKLESIVNGDLREISNILNTIPGIGPKTAQTIVEERDLFRGDLEVILKMSNVKSTYGNFTESPQVRFTGIRDRDLEQAFNDAGFDADGNKNVTKKTQILIVPYSGFESRKTKSVPPFCKIMAPEEAWQYLNNMQLAPNA